MTEYVYVVRWESRIDGQTECGNFKVCYRDEKDAEKAMMADVDETISEWNQTGRDPGTKRGRQNENGCVDYYAVHDGAWDEYCEWRIDKLEVA